MVASIFTRHTLWRIPTFTHSHVSDESLAPPFMYLTRNLPTEGTIMNRQAVLFSRALRIFTLSLFVLSTLQLASPNACAQDTVTGAFEGTVKSRSGEPIAGASIQFINQLTDVPIAKRSDSQGRFYQGLLPPGTYTIRVSAPNFQTREIELRLLATRANSVIPVPVTLDPVTTATTPTPTPTPGTATATTTQPPTTTQPSTQTVDVDRSILSDINTTDARRGGAFTDKEVSTLPLGGVTLVRSFDELALLLPGVAAPPQAIGNGTGPGVGSGVGTSGQFSVNGLRSRANNFTVDGSDNNDEDIGVRRQGFFSLVPQPIESIQEFQVISLLAPAQYGRNIGAQVNAVSKSGGNETHGAVFGLFNSSQLNAPNAFDSTSGDTTLPLQGRIRNANGTLGAPRNVLVNGTQAFVRNGAGAEDSFTLGQGGFVLGGALMPNKLFYFISVEGQLLNAVKEVNFAVPTVEQRGYFLSGATGLSVNPFNQMAIPNPPGNQFPTSIPGDAIFSFFPFPNNPTGVYGANTLTQELPASAQGKVASGKVDYNFDMMGRHHDFTARYNFTSDWRDVPVTGGALFSRLRPRVRTQNFSTFLNSELSGPNSTSPLFNQLRLSYGRTRLKFDEGRDEDFVRPSPICNPSIPLSSQLGCMNNAEDARFLLNVRNLVNLTLPGDPVASYGTFGTTFNQIGPVGQVDIAGFSPVGVDVFNFPQARVNNTYQVADTLSWRMGSHNIAFGADIRRTELISDLPRNARPLVTFHGSPRVRTFVDAMGNPVSFQFANTGNVPANSPVVIRPEDFAAAGAASGFFQSLVLPGRDSHINLRYYQLNFFGQDEWRIRPNLSLSFGLRYEFNTVPREAERRIESTFSTTLPTLVSGLADFIKGRTGIFDADKNNFAPRVGFAWSPNWFGPDRTTVIRGGYGIYYDQILGAVVSQSRNVFPTFTTINFGGGCCNIFGTNPILGDGFNIFNPLTTTIGGIPLVQPGTLNTLNPIIPVNTLLSTVFPYFPSHGSGRPFGATLPARTLEMPMAQQYSISFEQQLGDNMVFSAAYVGTLGRNLLRFTTPNLGSNYLPLVDLFIPTVSGSGVFSGVTLDPGGILPSGNFSPNRGRPITRIGPMSIFETTAESRYDALQIQLRGRLHRTFQFQAAYTFSKVEDDVSDVFDLAGAPALPQNSLTFAGENGPSNFDARHRFSYNFIYEIPRGKDRSAAYRFLLGGLQIAGTGQFQTGQPFTVNSLFDVNQDGNLTDRLNNTSGIQVTGNNSQPLILTTTNTQSMLAPWGTDGAIPRNTFRAGNVLSLDLSFLKKFEIKEHHSLTFRMDIFNFIDRANYGIPVRFLEAPGFGRAVDTVTPGRRIQLALKYSF